MKKIQFPIFQRENIKLNDTCEDDTEKEFFDAINNFNIQIDD